MGGRWCLALLVVLLLSPGVTAAQTCRGNPLAGRMDPGVHASISSYSYATALSGGLEANGRVHGGITARRFKDADLDAIAYDIEGTLGAQLRPDRLGGTHLCAAVAVIRTLGPYDLMVSDNDYESWSRAIILSGGRRVGSVRGLTFTPSASISFVHLRSRWHFEGAEVLIKHSRDSYYLAEGGVSIGRGRISVRPGLSVPWGLLGVSVPDGFAVPFGRENREVAATLAVSFRITSLGTPDR
jgi:hypothetical protein